MHLLIDGYGGQAGKLANESVLYQLLADLPRAIGMKTISYPVVQHYSGGAKPEDGGLSAIVLVAESHVSFHTFPARGLVWADVFSCKEFSADAVLGMVRSAFGLTHVRSLEVVRGLERPTYQDDWELSKEPQLRFPEAVSPAPSQS